MIPSGKLIAKITTIVTITAKSRTHQIIIPSAKLTSSSFKFFPAKIRRVPSCSVNFSSDATKMGDKSTPSSIYDLSYTNIDGVDESMEKYRGHVLIVVNTASKCGYTCVNYEQLTELYDKYSESEGLRILAFPCNQFMNEEPLGEKEIKEFAATYNVRYDMSKKVDVNGSNTHPVWAYLKKQQGGFIGDFVKWNFTKFLIDKKGNVVKRYAPTTNPKELEKDLLVYFKESG